jgi:hypothetical protein
MAASRAVLTDKQVSDLRLDIAEKLKQPVTSDQTRWLQQTALEEHMARVAEQKKQQRWKCCEQWCCLFSIINKRRAATVRDVRDEGPQYHQMIVGHR